MGTDPAFVCLDCSLVNRPALVKHDRVRAERDRLREALTGLLRYSTSTEYGTEGKRAVTDAVAALDAERS